VLNIASIIKLFLTLASSLAQYAHDKKMIELGESQAILNGIKDANDAIARAKEAVSKVNELPIEKDDLNRANKRVK
jgi:hypothetical protein